MKLRSHLLTPAKLGLFALALGMIPLTSLTAAPEKNDTSPVASDASKQKQFASPKEAADSLIAAAESFDVATLKEILGPDGEDLVSSSDPVMDKNRAIAF